jgi:membrane complex biogenesis BtpA family protein
MKNKFQNIFSKKSVIGMIHVQALPGTPNHILSPEKIIEKAVMEAEIYKNSGIDVIMIENMHDVPYQKNEVGHEISSLMSVIAYEIKRQTGLPLGIQILAGANRAAMAVALNAGADFIRAEGFVYGHLADEGYIDSDAAQLLRYRKQIGAEHIAIFTDIKKKHSSHAVTSDLDIVEIAQAAEFFLSDAVIITGSHTGAIADLNEIKKVKEQINLPVIVGSGVNIDNIEKYFSVADALIIGSYFKKDGNWQNDIDPDRVKKLMWKIGSL